MMSQSENSYGAITAKGEQCEAWQCIEESAI